MLCARAWLFVWPKRAGGDDMAKAVDRQFRLLYAVAIIIVVASHCGRGGLSLFYDWFTPYAFHLGIFAFGSGYFYREQDADNQLAYLIRKIRNFLVPVYVCNVFYGVFVALLHAQGFSIGKELSLYNLIVAPMTSGHQFMYNLGAWFVAPLFMVVIFNNIVYRIFKSIKYKDIAVFIIYCGLGILGVQLARYGMNKGAWLVLGRMLFFLPMYGLGIVYRKYRFFDNVPSLWYFFVVFAVQLVCIHSNGGLKGNNACWMLNLGSGLRPFVLEFLGILFWLRVTKILEPVLGENRFLDYVGRNTFSIMTHHLVGFMVVNLLFFTISEMTPLFADFNIKLFKSSVWYRYLPDKLEQYNACYLAAGIAVPLLFSYGKDKILEKINRLRNCV